MLAVTCGLVILVAGTIQLLRVADQTTGSPPVAAGATAKAGDASVTLLGVQFDTATLTAMVRIGGVDDPQGINGFTMVSAGSSRKVSGGTCQALTVAAQQCTLVFANSGLKGTPRQLLFGRAGVQLRWVLVGIDGAPA